MKKFFFYFLSSLVISVLLTTFYIFLDFKLEEWFVNDTQFIMIPGFLSILFGVSFGNSLYGSTGDIPVNRTFFSDQQKQKVSN